MGRPLRVDVGGEIFHVLNLANAKQKIFQHNGDFKAFEAILEEGLKTFAVRLYAYQIMPNHWHMVLSPDKDGELSRFVGWLTLTHTQRYHVYKGTVGYGHLYQGRYKSFLIEKDSYFIRVCRYVERNALRSGLVRRAEDWRWGSAWIRNNGSPNQKRMLSPWPEEIPKNYSAELNDDDEGDDNKSELDSIRYAVNKSSPFGNIDWKSKVTQLFGLKATTRPSGRPRKK